MADGKLGLVFDVLIGDDELIGALSKAQKKAKEFQTTSGKIGKAFVKLQKPIKGIASSVEGLASALAPVAGLIGAIGGTIFSKASIDAAIEQENAIKRLNTALQISGDFTEAASKDFQVFAASLQEVTKFGDEAILNQLALAKSFGATNEQAKQIATTATDVAEAFGIDIESATRNVAKTLGGFAGELGETIPALKELTTAQLRAGEGITLLAQRFGGTAIKQVQTFGGQMSQLSNRFGDFLEEVGFLVTQNPVVIKAISSLNKEIKGFIDLIKANQGSLKTFVANAVILFEDIFRAVKSAFNATVPVFTELADEFKKSFETIRKEIDFLGDTDFSFFDEVLKFPAKATLGFQLFTNEAIGFFFDLAAEATTAISKIPIIGKKLVDPTTIESFKQALQVNQIESGKLIGKIEELDEKVKSTFRPRKLDVEINEKKNVELNLKSGGEKDIFQSAFESINKNLDTLLTGFGTSLASSLGQGASGAATFLSQGLGAVADTILPGIGGVVSSIVGTLAQGPEKVKEFVTGFTDALPVIIENIIASIPVLVENLVIGLVDALVSLLENLDVIIITLVDGLLQAIPKIVSKLAISLARTAPFIAQKLAISLSQQAPFIAISFVESLIAETPRLISEMIKQFFDQIKNVGGLVGGAGGGLLGGIGGLIGLQRGGEIVKVPSGFEGDTALAKVSSGELVVDRGVTSQLKDFLNSGGNNSNDSEILEQILIALKQPVTVSGKIQNIDNSVLANQMITINRGNLRTS